jgi:uncharacterized protein YcnI
MAATRRALGALVTAAALLALLAAPAAAHVTANPNAVDTPEFTVGFRVGHGCDGSPTTAVRILLPPGVADAEPVGADGWEGEVVEEDGSTRIQWTGGSVPGGQEYDFVLSGRFTAEADDLAYFPLVQECAEGEHRWIDIPPSVEEWGSLAEPAPYVRLAYRERGVVEEPEPTVEPTVEPAAEPAATSWPIVTGFLVALLAVLGGVVYTRARRP